MAVRANSRAAEAVQASAGAPIAIVGAGPVGLTLALLLARRGVASTVLDARTLAAAQTDRRWLALSRGTLQTLAPLVALPASVTAEIRTVVVSSRGEFGRVVIDGREADGEALGAVIAYGDLIGPLAAAAAEEPLITVHRPCRVTALQQEPGRAWVRVDGAADQEASVIVNAEGLPAEAAPPARQFAIVADVDVAGVAAGTAFERFTRDGPLALLPTPAQAADRDLRRLALVWCMGAAAAERRMGLADEGFLAELRREFGAQRAELRAIGPRRQHALSERVREALHEHRVVHLGNAAQTLHPVAGQGLNLGIRDCVALATAVTAALTERRDPQQVLADYERGRRVDRAAIVRMTRTVPQLFASRFTPLALGRSAALTALSLVPPLRREFARTLMFGVRT